MSSARRNGPVIAVLVAAVLAFVGLIIAARMAGRSSSGADPTAASPTAEPTTASDTSSTQRTTTTRRTTSSAPTSFSAVAGLATNPLTAVRSLGKQPCVLPGWSPDPPAIQGFLNGVLGCLDAAWQPVLDSLKVPFQRASVVTTPELAATDCGRPPEQNSYYCAGVIYVDPRSFFATAAGPQGVPAAAVSLVAHEYGHHLQQLSATLPTVVSQMDAAGRDSPTGLELSRRTELQAQCLAGMFVGATFDPASIRLAQQDNWERGDRPGAVPDHGRPANFGLWFTRGVDRNSLDVCNTWTASPSSVG